jgi:hypothetical protein
MQARPMLKSTGSRRREEDNATARKLGAWTIEDVRGWVSGGRVVQWAPCG